MDEHGKKKTHSLKPIHDGAGDRTSTVVIYDCCNSLPVSGPSSSQVDFPSLQLLLTLPGHLVIMSSKVSEYSWFNNDGTLFTSALERTTNDHYDSITTLTAALNQHLVLLYKEYNLKSNGEIISVIFNGDVVCSLSSHISVSCLSTRFLLHRRKKSYRLVPEFSKKIWSSSSNSSKT
jgi:hypothetical protein